MQDASLCVVPSLPTRVKSSFTTALSPSCSLQKSHWIEVHFYIHNIN